MKKKIRISIFLLLTFSFVLVHDSIAHHHTEISDITHHNSQNNHNNTEEIVDLFSYFSHCINTSDSLLFVHQHNLGFQKTKIFKYFIESTNIVFKEFKIQIKVELSNYISILVKQHFYTTQSLRGPPFLKF